ncbi:RluA family pseudouridine synthase [uncultured Sphaerochaeta sp.]|uniref:RluA family pseudouridine synthase n=1 Tax=uncultured Sphaerochaeta sp. TaxID=886478 RepID=UPI002A0A9B92|nr:RluA family pseudouridine synthase [uncultured Sphaerochaeta sp.]
MAIQYGNLHFTVESLTSGHRLDAYVASHTTVISRGTLSLATTTILLNGKREKKSKLVKEGDEIDISYSQEFFEGLKAQDIPLTVLYEDTDILVIDKKQGMVVHPANGNYEGTVVNALLYRYGSSFTTNDTDEEEEEEEMIPTLQNERIRPGIVHRLDKDTSGVLVIARTRESHRNLAAQFKEHATEKWYIALAKGNFNKKQEKLITNLSRDKKNRKKFAVCPENEGKRAETEYLVLKQYKSFALLRIRIYTGRTHQIRVHLSSIGHPLVGDVIYGKPDGTTLMLHALSLTLESPSSKQRLCFRSPMPQRFKNFIKNQTL